MVKLAWDETGKKLYETGTDRGVLYPMDENGAYPLGVAWNGLTKVSESPDGAEETALYANNSKYLGLMSAENFKGTIEAYTYPKEFEACDGSAEIAKGVTIGQQTRAPFGLTYRTLIGNDVKENAYGYKLHLVYGCKVSPSERGYETVNDSPSAITFSWSFSATPVEVEGFNKTASWVIDSTNVDETALKALESALYGGDEAATAHLPAPSELLTILKTATPKKTVPPTNGK